MAGAGFKDFNSGDVLTASDVDTYLMQQTVMVFDDAAARTTALTGVVAEGMMSYLKDTNKTYRYDGSAWLDDAGTTSPLTTKGDVWGYSTTDARIPVGANGTVLTADSAESTGLKWASASADKTWSLVNAGGTALTGATTITVSGITGADQLFVVVDQASSANSNAYVTLYLNGDTTSANYDIKGFYVVGATTWAASSTVGTSGKFRIARMANNAGSAVDGYCYITGCNTSGLKMMNGAGGASTALSNNQINYSIGGSYVGGSAITEINIESSTGNFDNGTVYVYKA